jgi:hypothetical protein
LGDGGFEFGVGGIGDGAMGLPESVAVGRNEEDVGIVGGGKVDEFFPIRLVVINRNEVRVLGSGNLFTHAVENHRTNERRDASENG